MSQALRKLAGTLNRTDTICIFTNQLREKIGVMFGSPETTPGGRSIARPPARSGGSCAARMHSTWPRGRSAIGTCPGSASKSAWPAGARAR